RDRINALRIPVAVFRDAYPLHRPTAASVARSIARTYAFLPGPHEFLSSRAPRERLSPPARQSMSEKPEESARCARGAFQTARRLVVTVAVAGAADHRLTLIAGCRGLAGATRPIAAD